MTTMRRPSDLMESEVSIQTLLHELSVHQIELQMQNTELRQTQEALYAERERYFDLYDLAPMGYCTINEAGLITQVNLTASNLLGLPRNALILRPISNFIFYEDQDIYYLHRRDRIASGFACSCELRIQKADGCLFWAQLTATAMQNAEGIPIHRIVLNDISERKKDREALRNSEARYRALVEWSPDAVAVHCQGKLIYVNPAAIRLLGASMEADLLGQPIFRFIDPEFHHTATRQITELIEEGIDVGLIETKLLTLQGKLIAAEIQSSVISYDGKTSIHLVARDITERKYTQIQLLANQVSLRESAQHTQTILDNMVDGVITIDQRGVVETFNQGASRIFGYPVEEVVGRNVSMLMPVSYQAQHDSHLSECQLKDEHYAFGLEREVEGLRKDGTLFPVSLSISKITRLGQPVFVGILRDITQHRDNLERIQQLAFFDVLTGLPNRRLLTDRITQTMITSQRTGQHGALMFLDLDHFKRLNDTLGHSMGDVLLQQVASRLRDCVREGDSVARLGGDEFVVLLSGLHAQVTEAATAAETIALKILAALGQPYDLQGNSYTSTPSLGIVVFLANEESTNELLKRADAAMYQAKSAGRNTICFYDPAMQAATEANNELESEMRRDLAAQRFEVYYQIQVDAVGAPIGAEALVRWNHPTRGVLTPYYFITQAEETGLILPLGQWVLETACAQLVEWAHHADKADWTISVNVSAIQFSKADFLATVDAALTKTGARSRLLKLELTESMLINDVEDVIVKMNTIKAKGVCFSLDDFGTGYSSLSYLKRLPLDQLKIDQSFVRDLLTDPNDAVIARTIVALGHSLGLTVIAEGVETAGQRDFLVGLGCDTFQGYYFSKPQLARDIGV